MSDVEEGIIRESVFWGIIEDIYNTKKGYHDDKKELREIASSKRSNYQNQ